MHQGCEVTSWGQYFAIIQNSLCQGKQDSALGTRGYKSRIVFWCNKTLLWGGKHDIALRMRGYKLRTILFYTKRPLLQDRQDPASRMRGYKFRTMFCYQKNITMARQARHYIKHNNLQWNILSASAKAKLFAWPGIWPYTMGQQHAIKHSRCLGQG